MRDKYNINITSPPPFDVACPHPAPRSYGVAQVLLKAGALTGCRRKVDGKSALDLAVHRGDTSSLRELLAAGASTAGVNDQGLSVLHIAAQEGQAEAIDVLVDAGANLDCRDDDEDTPLHLACSFLQPDSVRALLRRDADETLLNDEDETPREIMGNLVPEDRRDEDVVEWITEMLARAPADRVWRRRGWLAMINARRKVVFMEDDTASAAQLLVASQKLRGQQRNGSGSDGIGTVSSDGGTVARRRVERWSGESSDVHPSLRKFHAVVTKLVDVTDELVFRRIVSYL